MMPRSKKRENNDVPTDAKMKKTIRTAGGIDKKSAEEFQKLGDLLPSFRKKEGPMSDEDLKKLFDALIGPTDKMYDSDDSIISEIDFMPDEEVAARDKKLLEMIESLPLVEEECKRAVCLFNMEKETIEEREARRRRIRERNMTTEEEKEKAERKRQKELRKREQRLSVHVQVFREKKKTERLPYVSCSQLASLFEILAEMLGEADESNREHRAKILDMDLDDYLQRIKFIGVRLDFYLDGKRTAEDMICSKVRRLLKDPSIVDVLMTNRYGFEELTTSQMVHVFSKYFRRNSPPPNADPSLDALSINIRRLVEAAYIVARKGNANFVINETLRSILYD